MSILANRFIQVFLPKIAKIAAKASLNQFGFGFAGDVLFEAAESFFKGAAPADARKALEEIIQKPAEFAKNVEAAIADQPAEVQAAAKLYFDQVPNAIRRGALTLGGREDIARGTLSNEIPLLNANDLWDLIPQSMPNFKVGDKPVESTDLELTGFLGKGGFGEVWRAKPLALIPECGTCGLHKGCLTPYMKPSGRGRKKVLLLAEAPGANYGRTFDFTADC